MPPPPPRRMSDPTSMIPLGVAAAADGDVRTTTATNSNNQLKRRRATIASSDGLPPRPPPAKRARSSAVALEAMAAMTTDKENTVNHANDKEDEEDEDDEEEESNDKLVYKGPLEDPEEAEEEEDDDQDERKAEIEAEFRSMMKAGLDAFQGRERLQQENNTLQDDNAAKALEIARLRTALKQKQEIITNLLKASETAKADARQSSRSTVTEATLRLELAKETEEKNQALAQAAISRGKAEGLENEKHQIKIKLQRVTAEKFKLERERQAQQHLAQNLDQQSASDTAFYKRKVAELTGQAQALNAALLEKDRTIQDMRRQLERSLSRAAAAKRRSSDNGGGNKSKRHS